MIDTHTHVVSPDHATYPLNPRDLSGQWYVDGPASADELDAAMTESDVERARFSFKAWARTRTTTAMPPMPPL